MAQSLQNNSQRPYEASNFRRNFGNNFDTVVVSGFSSYVRPRQIVDFFTLKEGHCKCVSTKSNPPSVMLRFSSPVVAQKVVLRYNDADVYGRKLRIFSANNHWEPENQRNGSRPAEMPALMSGPNTPSRQVQPHSLSDVVRPLPALAMVASGTSILNLAKALLVQKNNLENRSFTQRKTQTHSPQRSFPPKPRTPNRSAPPDNQQRNRRNPWKPPICAGNVQKNTGKDSPTGNHNDKNTVARNQGTAQSQSDTQKCSKDQNINRKEDREVKGPVIRRKRFRRRRSCEKYNIGEKGSRTAASKNSSSGAISSADKRVDKSDETSMQKTSQGGGSEVKCPTTIGKDSGKEIESHKTAQSFGNNIVFPIGKSDNNNNGSESNTTTLAHCDDSHKKTEEECRKNNVKVSGIESKCPTNSSIKINSNKDERKQSMNTDKECVTRKNDNKDNDTGKKTATEKNPAFDNKKSGGDLKESKESKQSKNGTKNDKNCSVDDNKNTNVGSESRASTSNSGPEKKGPTNNIDAQGKHITASKKSVTERQRPVNDGKSNVKESDVRTKNFGTEKNCPKGNMNAKNISGVTQANSGNKSPITSNDKKDKETKSESVSKENKSANNSKSSTKADPQNSNSVKNSSNTVKNPQNLPNGKKMLGNNQKKDEGNLAKCKQTEDGLKKTSDKNPSNDKTNANKPKQGNDDRNAAQRNLTQGNSSPSNIAENNNSLSNSRQPNGSRSIENDGKTNPKSFVSMDDASRSRFYRFKRNDWEEEYDSFGRNRIRYRRRLDQSPPRPRSISPNRSFARISPSRSRESIDLGGRIFDEPNRSPDRNSSRNNPERSHDDIRTRKRAFEATGLVVAPPKRMCLDNKSTGNIDKMDPKKVVGTTFEVTGLVVAPPKTMCPDKTGPKIVIGTNFEATGLVVAPPRKRCQENNSTESTRKLVPKKDIGTRDLRNVLIKKNNGNGSATLSGQKISTGDNNQKGGDSVHRGKESGAKNISTRKDQEGKESSSVDISAGDNIKKNSECFCTNFEATGLVVAPPRKRCQENSSTESTRKLVPKKDIGTRELRNVLIKKNNGNGSATLSGQKISTGDNNQKGGDSVHRGKESGAKNISTRKDQEDKESSSVEISAGDNIKKNSECLNLEKGQVAGDALENCDTTKDSSKNLEDKGLDITKTSAGDATQKSGDGSNLDNVQVIGELKNSDTIKDSSSQKKPKDQGLTVAKISVGDTNVKRSDETNCDTVELADNALKNSDSMKNSLMQKKLGDKDLAARKSYSDYNNKKSSDSLNLDKEQVAGEVSKNSDIMKGWSKNPEDKELTIAKSCFSQNYKKSSDGKNLDKVQVVGNALKKSDIIKDLSTQKKLENKGLAKRNSASEQNYQKISGALNLDKAQFTGDAFRASDPTKNSSSQLSSSSSQNNPQDRGSIRGKSSLKLNIVPKGDDRKRTESKNLEKESQILMKQEHCGTEKHNCGKENRILIKQENSGTERQNSGDDSQIFIKQEGSGTEKPNSGKESQIFIKQDDSGMEKHISEGESQIVIKQEPFGDQQSGNGLEKDTCNKTRVSPCVLPMELSNESQNDCNGEDQTSATQRNSDIDKCSPPSADGLRDSAQKDIEQGNGDQDQTQDENFDRKITRLKGVHHENACHVDQVGMDVSACDSATNAREKFPNAGSQNNTAVSTDSIIRPELRKATPNISKLSNKSLMPKSNGGIPAVKNVEHKVAIGKRVVTSKYFKQDSVLFKKEVNQTQKSPEPKDMSVSKMLTINNGRNESENIQGPVENRTRLKGIDISIPEAFSASNSEKVKERKNSEVLSQHYASNVVSREHVAEQRKVVCSSSESTFSATSDTVEFLEKLPTSTLLATEEIKIFNTDETLTKDDSLGLTKTKNNRIGEKYLHSLSTTDLQNNNIYYLQHWVNASDVKQETQLRNDQPLAKDNSFDLTESNASESNQEKVSNENTPTNDSLSANESGLQISESLALTASAHTESDIEPMKIVKIEKTSPKGEEKHSSRVNVLDKLNNDSMSSDKTAPSSENPTSTTSTKDDKRYSVHEKGLNCGLQKTEDNSGSSNNSVSTSTNCCDIYSKSGATANTTSVCSQGTIVSSANSSVKESITNTNPVKSESKACYLEGGVLKKCQNVVDGSSEAKSRSIEGNPMPVLGEPRLVRSSSTNTRDSKEHFIQGDTLDVMPKCHNVVDGGTKSLSNSGSVEKNTISVLSKPGLRKGSSINTREGKERLIEGDRLKLSKKCNVVEDNTATLPNLGSIERNPIPVLGEPGLVRSSSTNTNESNEHLIQGGRQDVAKKCHDIVDGSTKALSSSGSSERNPIPVLGKPRLVRSSSRNSRDSEENLLQGDTLDALQMCHSVVDGSNTGTLSNLGSIERNPIPVLGEPGLVRRSSLNTQGFLQGNVFGSTDFNSILYAHPANHSCTLPTTFISIPTSSATGLQQNRIQNDIPCASTIVQSNVQGNLSGKRKKPCRRKEKPNRRKKRLRWMQNQQSKQGTGINVQSEKGVHGNNGSVQQLNKKKSTTASLKQASQCKRTDTKSDTYQSQTTKDPLKQAYQTVFHRGNSEDNSVQSSQEISQKNNEQTATQSTQDSKQATGRQSVNNGEISVPNDAKYNNNESEQMLNYPSKSSKEDLNQASQSNCQGLSNGENSAQSEKGFSQSDRGQKLNYSIESTQEVLKHSSQSDPEGLNNGGTSVQVGHGDINNVHLTEDTAISGKRKREDELAELGGNKHQRSENQMENRSLNEVQNNQGSNQAAGDDGVRVSRKERRRQEQESKFIWKNIKAIEEQYNRECNTLLKNVKMLVSTDPSLAGKLTGAFKESLTEIGRKLLLELHKLKQKNDEYKNQYQLTKGNVPQNNRRNRQQGAGKGVAHGQKKNQAKGNMHQRNPMKKQKGIGKAVVHDQTNNQQKMAKGNMPQNQNQPKKAKGNMPQSKTPNQPKMVKGNKPQSGPNNLLNTPKGDNCQRNPSNHFSMVTCNLVQSRPTMKQDMGIGNIPLCW